MNVSTAFLAIMLCLEAQQHHSSLAEETPQSLLLWSLSPCLPSQHALPLSTFHNVCCTSKSVLQQCLSSINNSAAALAAASAFIPVALCLPHAPVWYPLLYLPHQREETALSSQGKLMVWLSCYLRWVEKTIKLFYSSFMTIITRQCSCYLGICWWKSRYWMTQEMMIFFIVEHSDIKANKALLPIFHGAWLSSSSRWCQTALCPLKKKKKKLFRKSKGHTKL